MRQAMVFLFLFFIPAMAFGGQVMVELESGRVFEAVIIEETEKQYIFEVKGVEVPMQKFLIKSVSSKEEASVSEERKPEDTRAQEAASAGRICGTIHLVPAEAQGHLYVWFSPVMDEAGPAPARKYYQAIAAEDIKGTAVAYVIDNIPPGEYQGYVTWDTGEPKWKKSWGNGNYPAYPGDYTGMTVEPVVVEADAQPAQEDIDCVFFLKPAEKKHD